MLFRLILLSTILFIYPAYSQDSSNKIALLLPVKKIGQNIADSIIKGMEDAHKELNSGNYFSPEFVLFDSTPLGSDVEKWELMIDSLERDGFIFFIGPITRDEVSTLQKISDDLFIPGLALNNTDIIYNIEEYEDSDEDNYSMPPLVHVSLSSLDDLNEFTRYFDNYENNKSIAFVPDHFSYDYVKHAVQLDENKYEVWYFENNQNNFNDLVKTAINSNNSLSRHRLLKAITGNYSLVSQPRRRKDLNSFMVIGTSKQITNIISYLRYYYVRYTPLFISESSIDNWTQSTLSKFSSTFAFTSKWVREFPFSDVYKTWQKSPYLKKINRKFYGYGFDSYVLATNIINEVTADYAGKLGLYIYNKKLRRFIIKKDLTYITGKKILPVDRTFLQKKIDESNSLSLQRERIKREN